MINKFKLVISGIIAFVIFIVVLATFMIFKFEHNHSIRITLLVSVMLVILMSAVLIVSVWMISRKQRVKIKQSLEQYMEELISVVGVGTIMFSNNGIIIWTSKFINERFNNSLMGKKIIDIHPNFTKEFYSERVNFIFELNNMFYEATVVQESNFIIIKDVSEKKRIKDQYINERTVIGEVDIDNFQEYLSTLPEEDVFAIQAAIIKVLDTLVEEYSIIYRQYVNGKFLIITNAEILQKLEEKKFQDLTHIKTHIKISGVKPTVSAGFGVGSIVASELMKLAKDSISQSQSRGGNQVTVAYPNQDYKHFGAKTETPSSSSRVSITKISKLLFHKLRGPVIKTVFIYGHNMMDLDALGSTYAIYEQAISSGKEAYIVGSIFDNSTRKAIKKFIPNHREVFVKPVFANKTLNKKSTMVVICDVADPKRTENIRAIQDIPAENIFIFDHHRVSEIPKGVLKEQTHINTAASSASEIVSEVIQFSGLNIKPSTISSQLLLGGIYLDTKIFRKQVSSRTFAAAAWLEKFGAQAQESVDLLKFSEEQSKIINNILLKTQEVKKGFYLAAYDGEAASDITAAAADEILRTQGRVAAFVVTKVPGKKLFKLSARSAGVNIQIIAEKVGGGGHFAAAAAVSNETLEVFKDNIIQAIVGTKYESNIDK